LILSAPPSAILVAHTPPSSPILIETPLWAPFVWLGHHGFFSRHLSSVLCSSYHLDSHGSFGFCREGLDASKQSLVIGVHHWSHHSWC
jgi:hypothetical protein